MNMISFVLGVIGPVTVVGCFFCTDQCGVPFG
jgi:hypothetical protein